MKRLAIGALGAVLLAYTALSQEPLFSQRETQLAKVSPSLAARADVQAFIRSMVSKHRFDQAHLHALFASIRSRDDIIAKISRPAEKSKPWHAYREIFLGDERIRGGAGYWRQHRAVLARAEQDHGVPPEIILAILGVETHYGRITGRDGVLEALATLAFDYPRRSEFFRQELEHYLILTREERIDPLSLTGSYAGAMGLAQFMPSSYRRYAVDFDRDGQRDLWRNPADAIGSIGNYLARHGWQRGQPIAVAAQVRGTAYRAYVQTKPAKPQYRIAELRRAGVTPAQAVADDQLAVLLELEGENGPLYWLVFKNFYVITRYNHSTLYAMAVYQLAQAIRQAYLG